MINNEHTKFFYTNCAGLLNKIPELHTISVTYNCKVLCITETHLHPGIFNAEVSIPNYQIFRKDRNSGSDGGGSIIYVHNSVSAVCVESFNAPDSLAVQINFDSCPVIFCCVYRSMNLTNSQDDEIMNQIRSLALVDDQELILVGDFNLPDVCWDSGRVNSPKDTINQKLLLQKAYLDLSMKQT